MGKTVFTDTKGQILVLYAFGIIVLIALAVLVLDGGMLFLNRRAAQAAADAGALAGARVKCNGSTYADVIAVAEHYAEVENGASEANASAANFPQDDVVVNVTIQQDSFLAQIFGRNTLDVPAMAAANCFPPNAAKNVIPVAWSCRAPVIGASDSVDCQIQALEWATEMIPLANSNFYGTIYPGLTIHGETVPQPFQFKGSDGDITDQIYIIMDSDDLVIDMATDCMPVGTINCDIDGDGAPNISASGDRSWLLLEEGKGAADLAGWIQYGLATPLNIHTWLAGTSGDKNVVFKRVEDYLMATAADPYKFGTLPVFNDYCPSNPYLELLCSSKLHSEDLIVRNDPNNYFHIIGFAAFYVTCVDDTGQVECPGSQAANLPGNAKSVEGYFVSGAPVTIAPGGTGGVDTGVYVVSLTQ